jgi:hypothetical protein
LADIFHEVDEEVRRERMKRLWDQYGLYVLILVVLFVAGIAGWRGWEYYENQRAAAFGSQFEAASALAETGNFAEAEKDFAKIAADGNRGYRVLARLREAEATIPRDSTRLRPIRASTSASATWPRSAPGFCSRIPRRSPRWRSGSNPSPPRVARSATPRVNCWRCRRSARATRRRCSAGRT